jgi:hypothetical protein
MHRMDDADAAVRLSSGASVLIVPPSHSVARAPMAPKPAWHELEPPSTAQGHIAYLAACQDWFTELHDARAPHVDVDLTVRPSVSAGRLPSVAYDPVQSVVLGSSQCVQCAICERNAIGDDIRATLISPFASLVGLTCATCALAPPPLVPVAPMATG